MEDTQLGSLHYNTPLGLYPFIPFPVSETLVLSQQHQRFEIEGCIDTVFIGRDDVAKVCGSIRFKHFEEVL